MSSSDHGVSLKSAHYEDWLRRTPQVPWVEAVTENFLGRGGRPWAVLEQVRRDARVILHGVSMSLGGLDPFDPRYFEALRQLRQRIEAAFVSDHLSFGTFGGYHGHDLWPLPCNEESLRHVAARVRQAQDMLGEQIVVENVSSYVAFCENQLDEATFMAELLIEADAGLLLDLNNVHVSAHNLGFDARGYIDALPAQRVRYYHLAGHADMGTYLLDNHGSSVCEAVWQLYEYAVQRVGVRPTIVEWDCHLPSLDGLLAESARAAGHERAALEGQVACA